MIGDYRDIILAPVITEKAAMIAEAGNKIFFKVKPSANKVQIRQAIEKMQISTQRDLLEESANIGDLKKYKMMTNI